MRQGVTLRSTSTSRKIRASRCRISNSNSSRHYASRRVRMRPQSAATTPGGLEVGSEESVDQIKLKLLKLAAATDRGQLLFQQKVYDLDKYNSDSFDEIQNLVAKLREKQIESDNKGSDDDLSLHDGKWELVLATAQLFRCSPFFIAISEAMDGYTWHAPWSDPSTAVPSGTLFFRLHELQVMSWGASTIGKVTQTVDIQNKMVSSTFDTILFRLTVIPIVGWFKLLPTFGGRVESFAKGLEVEKEGDGRTTFRFELEKTKVDSVDGIPRPPFFLAWLLGKDFPVNAVWKLLPWNRGKAPTCTSYVIYVDEDFRVCEDKEGDLFIYLKVPAENES
eukprot:CAMPEP_0197481160 /NCGR_PEP_ID=MMETSP1309-20131121/45695_1 /TAXON_ID=464262 /ORGANISM="Genus nov. species nov., Strain RCC998" /LENGTH=334 /DNA_ID=CAMNT_0043023319 /DNA_START=1 /DNA_END=1005 /DNA_ORIENTATION=+